MKTTAYGRRTGLKCHMTFQIPVYYIILYIDDEFDPTPPFWVLETVVNNGQEETVLTTKSVILCKLGSAFDHRIPEWPGVEVRIRLVEFDFYQSVSCFAHPSSDLQVKTGLSSSESERTAPRILRL